jgi:hypothetical protein
MSAPEDLCSDLSKLILERQRCASPAAVYEYAYSATSGNTHQAGAVWANGEVEALAKIRARMYDAGACFPLDRVSLTMQTRGL